ncbi:MAG: hypothetical protein KGD70_16565 [Candidatus Lokiarchaeota archaeon]|nr:hypothetical protein [Candidatus Lokiarchaeota archaeon]
MPTRNSETVRLSVFKGRESSLNRAIIQALVSKEPQTTNQLFTKIAIIEEFKDISYSTVNKRVRSLEQSGYIKKVLVKKRVGGLSNYYELRPKVYLAQFLASNNIYKLFEQADDQLSLTFLAAFIKAKNQELKPQNLNPTDEKIDT